VEQLRPSPSLLAEPEEILVRGASAPAPPTETLLRSASSSQETEPEQMLRASAHLPDCTGLPKKQARSNK
jgi:hypothetical protein